MSKAFKFLVGIGFSVLFFWLALKGVDIDEVIETARTMSFGWIAPFAIIILIAHYLRAERWKMLLSEEQEGNRLTLFTSVMLAYMLNYAFPRLGEVTRPVYVAKKEQQSSSKLMGTIVLERVIDMASMLVLMVAVALFLISDTEKLSQVLGTDVTDPSAAVDVLLTLAIYGGAFLVLLGLGYVIVKRIAATHTKVQELLDKVTGLAKTFIQGLFSIRELKNWPLFILYTALIWVCYTLMTFIPFWMFDLQAVYNLDLLDAVVITVIAAIGIIVPAPGGIGPYHWFTSQALFILYLVPTPVGFAYATINHATSMLVILVCTPLLLFFDKYYSMKRE